MKQVLFVCTGNICRSPMAEALFRQHMGSMHDWKAVSAGVHAEAGRPASENAVEALREVGIDLAAHRSQPVTAELVAASDLVVVMAQHHKDLIARSFPQVADRVFLINAFGTSKVPADVSDPYGGSLETYRKTRDEIDRALSDLILFIHTGKK